MNSKSLKGTWPQAFAAFFFPIFIILCIRWIVVEPFVIPSGSMIPNLLIHDHLLVKKFSFGAKLPFTDIWLARWNQPKRGEIVVFKYPVNPEVFYIKRLIGLPGDQIEILNGAISINGEKISLVKDFDEDGFTYFTESLAEDKHTVRFYSDQAGAGDGSIQSFVVPEGHYFMMGDNRDQSADSRSWGFVPEKYLVGRAWVIWLSCEEMLKSSTYLCDPLTMRWDRFLKTLSF